MPVRVLVVDDSGFFRRRVTEMLESDPRLEVVGAAVDGQDAIDKTLSLKPDVITMDIEMPVMDGITALKRIMSRQPTPTLMFSSLTTDGAQATLDALDAGAVDYLPKRFEDISRDRDEAKKMLCERVYSVGNKRKAPSPSLRPSARPATAARATAAAPAARPTLVPSQRGPVKLVAIGTSTGGPVALQEVLTQLPASFPVPLILIQHMPGSFTGAFAQRLDQQCAISVKEAQDGDVLEAGKALLAPGGKQMMLEARGPVVRVRVQESAPEQNYKPCVDISFTSAAKAFPGKVLGVILTGMGADGREGARTLKQGGSEIWAQDEASSVIYGMPAAVAEAGLVSQILPLSEIGAAITKRV